MIPLTLSKVASFLSLQKARIFFVQLLIDLQRHKPQLFTNEHGLYEKGKVRLDSMNFNIP